MIVSIHQPHYMPWGGYFYKILNSDIFILLDDVQYSKNDFINRNLIKTANGTCYITVPVNASISTPINEVPTHNNLWCKKHIKTITLNYKKAPYFKLYAEEIFHIIESSPAMLCELNIALIKYFSSILHAECTFLTSSQIISHKKREARVIDLVKKVNGTVYLSGTGAMNYQDPAHFTTNGIELRYSNYTQTPYPQLWGNFEPSLAILDMLFNCGEASRNIILGSPL